MFKFQKLEVYQISKQYNISINQFLIRYGVDPSTKDQLKRASLSIMLNIAEGIGRQTIPDKRRFLTMARGSIFECAAIFDYLLGIEVIDRKLFEDYSKKLEQLSKMLYSLSERLK